MIKKQIVTLFILCLNAVVINAQTSKVTKYSITFLDTSSIDHQFEYIKKKSSNYLEYKVVKKAWLNRLKENTLDSLKTIKSEIENRNAEINQQNTTISNLTTALNTAKSNLAAIEKQKDSMLFFGITLPKTVYNIGVCAILVLTLSLLGFFIFKFKNSNRVTKAVKTKFADLEDEYEDYRRTALEREQKVRRQLQDEINRKKKQG